MHTGRLQFGNEHTVHFDAFERACVLQQARVGDLYDAPHDGIRVFQCVSGYSPPLASRQHTDGVPTERNVSTFSISVG